MGGSVRRGAGRGELVRSTWSATLPPTCHEAVRDQTNTHDHVIEVIRVHRDRVVLPCGG
jgi:hypothetical protein